MPRWDQTGRRRGSIDSAFSSDDYEHEERLKLGRVAGAETYDEEFEMTVTHSKILILVSKYGHCAVTPEEATSLICMRPLCVMLSTDIAYCPAGKLGATAAIDGRIPSFVLRMGWC